MRTAKRGRTSFLRKILTKFRRSSNSFTTLPELVMETNRDISEPNEGVDFGDRYASGLPSNSQTFHQTHDLPKDSWYGEKYFECLIAHDLLHQTASDERISTISSTHTNSIKNYPFRSCWEYLRAPGSLVKQFAQSAEVLDYRIALFALIGTITRQGSTDERKTLLASIRKFSHSHRLNSNRAIAEGNQGNGDGCSLNKAPSQSSTPEARTMEDPDEQGVEIPAQQTVQSRLEQRAEQPNNHAPQDEDGEDISQYTSALKEHGDQIGEDPVYGYETISLVPRLFRASVAFQQINVTADGSTRKSAKHRASKEACILLGMTSS